MNNIVDVIEQEKRPSWTATIVAIPVGKDINAPYSKLSTISSVISGRIRMMYPQMKFTTSKVEIKKGRKIEQYLNIKRIA